MSKHIRLFLAAIALTISSVASAATFNLFQPASGILVGNPSTYVTTAATSSNVIALWSGTCDATTYLRGDGACAAVPAGVVGANPSASVGLTAVNGSAGTFLRSDGAPALSQSISPTWTARHQFTSSGAARTNSPIYVNAAVPTIRITESDQAADAQDWLLTSTAGVLTYGATADGSTQQLAAGRALQFGRTGSDLASITFGNGTSNPSYTWLGSGAWSVNSSVGTSGQVLTSGGAGVSPSWTTVGGSAAGSTGQLQYNNAGAFAASSNLTFDGSNTVTLNGVLKGVTTSGATPGGSLTVSAGDANGSAIGGNLTLASGSGDQGGTLFATGGNADTTFGGNVQITGGQSSASGGGGVEIIGGEGATTGGDVSVTAGPSNNGDGASIAITAADGVGTNRNGGNVEIGTGVGTGSGSGGAVIFATAGVNRFFINPSGSWGLAGGVQGSSGQVLTSNGSGAAPTWQATPAPTSSGASATAGGSTSATNGSAVTVALSTEEFDTGNFHDTTTNNSRVILPGGTGYASCSGSISMFTGNTQTNTYMEVRLALRKNGTMYIAQAVDNWFAVSAGSSVFVWLTVSNAMIPANGTDYVEMVVLQNGASSAGTITANSNNSSGITRLTCTAV